MMMEKDSCTLTLLLHDGVEDAGAVDEASSLETIVKLRRRALARYSDSRGARDRRKKANKK
jgi:hypothetical protein